LISRERTSEILIPRSFWLFIEDDPIMLTAAAAILGMVPLNPSIWGPMAVAIAGGLLGVRYIVTTIYAVWFKV
jgi:multidrug efflux pump subunit AcrB